MVEDHDPETYAALRVDAYNRTHRSPVVADYELASAVVEDYTRDPSAKELIALIAMTAAIEREIAAELAVYAVETEIMMLITLGETPSLEELSDRLCARIRAVAFPPNGETISPCEDETDSPCDDG